ncbi:unnamed protein product [Cuscuta epithymum]|uniref:Uncharacterized protein n=1 Tax=Cuscuta epithymum TaxID=186058 RepID=A0AAV0DYN5_9ASTE|nr:unnamed protein product [Cuscuta epithymum]
MEVLLIDLGLLLVGVNRELCLGCAWNYGRGFSNRNHFQKLSTDVNILIRIFTPNNPGSYVPAIEDLGMKEPNSRFAFEAHNQMLLRINIDFFSQLGTHLTCLCSTIFLKKWLITSPY